MTRPRRTVMGVLSGILGIFGLSAVAGALVAVTVIPTVAVTSTAAGGTISIFDNMPSYLELDRLMLPTTLHTRNPDNGEWQEFTSFYDQNRSPVEYAEVSPVMYDAILSSEDPRYFQHGGVDLIGTTRALLSNAQGGATQGGSSISQQYVKNVLVQRCERDAVATEKLSRDVVLQQCWEEATDATGVDGYQRKLQEMRYAIQLEQEYSKNDILLGYLNIANFGGRNYGIAAASRYYFGVEPSQVSVGQAATLAGIVQNPNSYRVDQPLRAGNAAPDGVVDAAPGQIEALDDLLASGEITPEQHLAAADGYTATKGRQLYVLTRMLEDQRTDRAQYVAAAVEPIVPNVQPALTGCATTAAPFFCQYVVNTARNDPAYAEAFGETPDDRDRSLRRDGLNIYTTLDWRMQNTAQASMYRYAPESVPGMEFGSTAVSVEAGTGRILSIAQNNRFTEDPALAQNDPNYVSLVYAGDSMHGASTGFGTGSTFKLFTLIDWLEHGHSVNETMDGRSRVIPRLEDSCDGPWINLENTLVRNFGDVPGTVGTPVQFTASSLNSGYLAMAERLDLCDIQNVATKMGVTLSNGNPVRMDGAASIIGSNAVSPVSMASAYATVANGGSACTPYVIERVTDADGNDLPVPGARCTQVLTPGVAGTAAFALQAVMAPGGTGAGGNPNDGTPMIGKTGTNETLHTWLVESSTTVATAVWAGNTRGEGNVFAASHNGLELSNIRTPMAREIQAEANRLYPGGAFGAPDPALIREVNPPSPEGEGNDGAPDGDTPDAGRPEDGGPGDGGPGNGGPGNGGPGGGGPGDGGPGDGRPGNGRGGD